MSVGRVTEHPDKLVAERHASARRDLGHLLPRAQRLLGPREATLCFLRPASLHYPRPPLPLSRIACDLVRLAEDAPELRRGQP